jgi:type II secretory pathway pseudopilin PulG
MELGPLHRAVLYRKPKNGVDAGPASSLCRSRRVPAHAGGFSLIEALIAAAILLVIAVGVLPLFIRSMINIEGGAEFTQVSNAARSRAEELFELSFNSDLLLINAGTELLFVYFFSKGEKVWRRGVEADAVGDDDLALLRRTARIRQFNVNDLTSPLDDSAPLGSVQIKEITVQVQSTRTGSPLGPGKRTSVRVFKSQ